MKVANFRSITFKRQYKFHNIVHLVSSRLTRQYIQIRKIALQMPLIAIY